MSSRMPLPVRLALAPSMVLLSACASAGPPRPSGPLSWPAGEYRLEGRVQYTQASDFAESRAEETFRAELLVVPGGQLSMRSDSGICREPSLTQLRQDEERGRRSFECGNATFTVWPSARSIAGELKAVVTEERRVRGACMRYVVQQSGAQTCAAYSWEIVSQPVTKDARLRVFEGT